ncbi:hypothetical protein G3T18_02380 [Oscillatoria salina IIICB1]|nr:hypothetical protein [Oscillatoria salina IIICB1]NET89407.1 hypothetical protein [Kamptonema sp. SIO1D9]
MAQLFVTNSYLKNNSLDITVSEKIKERRLARAESRIGFFSDRESPSTPTKLYGSKEFARLFISFN